MAGPNHVQIVIPEQIAQQNQCNFLEDKEFDYSQRAQWLRPTVLGANDGLVSVASLMMGITAVKEDAKVMVLTRFAGLIAGACSMAIGEFISVYSQLDIEIAQIKRVTNNGQNEEEIHKEKLPNPFHAALASALDFALGSVLLLLVAGFVENYKGRIGVVVAAVT